MKMKCLNHHDREAERRGLCYSCYQMLYRKICKGEITDASAVRKGMMLKKRPPGRKRSVLPFPKT